MKFEINYEHNLIGLYGEIIARSYQIRPSICFVVDKPVKREIFAADFRDRVVHHLVCGYINPIFERVFIHDSYSCRKGKGTLFGIRRLEKHIRSCSKNYTSDCYILKLDLQGYFMSIKRELLLQKLVALLERYPIGFPDIVLESIIENRKISLKKEKEISIELDISLEEVEFMNWKDDCTKSLNETKIPSEMSQMVQIYKEEAKDTYNQLVAAIRSFPLMNSTPMECMQFISELQKSI